MKYLKDIVVSKFLSLFSNKLATKITFFASTTFLLTGCLNLQPPSLQTTIQAVNFLNPNIYGHAAPVVLTLYQSKSTNAFQQASFFSLYNHADSVLAGDLLDKRTVEIRPRQRLTIPIILAAQTTYLGVLAAFRDPDRAQWRQLIPVTPGKNRQLQISVATHSISLLQG